MTDSRPFHHVAVLGPGLLGGSVALACKACMSDVKVTLWGRKDSSLEVARKRSAADCYTSDLRDAVASADLVVLAVPIGVMRTLAEAFVSCLPAHALVTDVGSVKGVVHQEVGAYLTERGIPFIGSHPMAGSEKQGMDHAEADLFNGACVALTNEERVCEDKLNCLEKFWCNMGASCLRLGAREHDVIVAGVSHLPHALAALCAQLSLEGINPDIASKLASTGFRDTTRVASGPPSMWAEILLENREALLHAMDGAKKQLELLTSMLEQGESTALEAWLANAKKNRELLINE